MEDFDIEIIETHESDINTGIQLPLNYVSVGETSVDDVKVYIHQAVYKELKKYSQSDTSHELGTILVGDYIESAGSLSVMISAYIQARYTDSSAATLTFTHDTWNDIFQQLD